MEVGAMETVGTVRASGEAEQFGGEANWGSALLHWVNMVSMQMFTTHRTHNTAL